MGKCKKGRIKKKRDNIHSENCAILVYYAAISGNFLPTFRDNLCLVVKILDPWKWEQFLIRCRNLISRNMLNLPWLLCELMNSHRRFGTIYRSHLQGTRILTPEHGSSSHLIRCRNLISRNMFKLPRISCEVMYSHRRFRTTYRPPSNWRQNSEITQHARNVTWYAATFKNAPWEHQNNPCITRHGANCRPIELTAGRHAASGEV